MYILNIYIYIYIYIFTYINVIYIYIYIYTYIYIQFSKIFCEQLSTFSSNNVYSEFQQSYNNKDILIELLIHNLLP